MKTKSLGQIGVGRWGQNLARVFHQLGVLHSLCDIDARRLLTARKNNPSISLYTDLSLFLNDPDLKEIVIATPPATHYKLTKQALEFGKDVYVEKPLCQSTDQAAELIELAKKQGRILMVGHILHYHPCFIRLKQLIQEGEIGEIEHLKATRIIPSILDDPLEAMWDLAIHDISCALAICGNDYRDLSFEKQGNGIRLNFSYPRGTRVEIYAGYHKHSKLQNFSVRGQKGDIVFDDTRIWEEKLMFQSSLSKQAVGLDLLEKEPLEEEAKHFIECCQNRRTPLTNGEEALLGINILEQASFGQPVAHLSH